MPPCRAVKPDNNRLGFNGERESLFRWVIENKLARAQRPGYTGERGIRVSKVQVDNWISDVKELGVQSIICLLADDQLKFCISIFLPI
jgi:hypothetical protein